MGWAAEIIMLQGHDPWLVALSVAIAILGGYTGFGLAARIRKMPGASRRALLAGAAGYLAVSIWTMHFVGMLAAPLPSDTVYLVMPTISSFLICALVVGISLFFVSIGASTRPRLISSAVLLGAGIASMHYVGIHGLSGDFSIEHDRSMVILSILVAIVTGYVGLRVFLAQQEGANLIVSSIVFGIAVSGMHYTAMYGMHLVPVAADTSHHEGIGLAASQQMLSVALAVLCFVIAAGFLLSLVPDSRRQVAVPGKTSQPYPQGVLPPSQRVSPGAELAEPAPSVLLSPRLMAAPLGGLGQPPRPAPAQRLPIEGAEGTHFINVADVRSVRADAHYTRIHDGSRERMCPWSISQAEAQLDPNRFVRVHRSHIVAIAHITLVRKEGDGAIIELDGPSPHRVPVSRAKMSEVKARLGLARRQAITK